MSTNSAASQLSPALLADIEFGINFSKGYNGRLFRMFIEADEELLVCEYLRDLGADIDGDSELDGPDTIRCNGKGWTLVLKVN